jgi:DNA-binding HxlR family transcriptional regulator
MMRYKRTTMLAPEAAGESIPSNILADRLKRLEEHGIITKVAYQQHPTRYDYHVTPKGMDLQPIVQALFEWGTKYILSGVPG